MMTSLPIYSTEDYPHKGPGVQPKPVPEHYTRTRVIWVEIFSSDEPIPPTATLYHYGKLVFKKCFGLVALLV